MERNKRVVESDIRKFYSNSGFISDNVLYLQDFVSKSESWDMCISILNKHSSSTDKITKSTSSMLMYCATALKFHAYNGFKFQIEGNVCNKYRILWSICTQMLDLMEIYVKTHPQISAQLSSVLACAVIYGFDATQKPSHLLFLVALCKTEDGSYNQYLYLSSVAREALGKNISIHLNHRCGFLRACVAMAPKIFIKLITDSMLGQISFDHLKILAITDWLSIHVYLLKFFYPVIIEQKFLETCELFFEDTTVSTKKISDLGLIYKSLTSLIKLDLVRMLMNFIRYGVASENEKIIQSSAELSTYLLCICNLDMAGLLVLASKRYSETHAITTDKRWNLACESLLDKFSPVIMKFTYDFVWGMCKLGGSLLKCSELDKRIPFVKTTTSKWLLEIFISIASEHLPFVLHFGLVNKYNVQSLCKYINLYLYSSSYNFRVMALEFWSVFQRHLCPSRHDLSFINSSSVENIRSIVLSQLRPCFELFLEDLYKSCIVKQGESLEDLNLYREKIIKSINDALVITGPRYLFNMIKNDMEQLKAEINKKNETLDRCVFVTSIIANKIRGEKEVIRSVIMKGMDLVESKRLTQTNTTEINFYKNSVYRLILWTSEFIVRDEQLLKKTIKILVDQNKTNQLVNKTLDVHVLLDQAVLAICFSISPENPYKQKLIDYVSYSIANNVTPIDKRLEIIEGFMKVLESIDPDKASRIRTEMVKGFFYQVCDLNRVKRIPEIYLFLLAAMSSINFVNQEELADNFVQYVVEFVRRFKQTEELWETISEVLVYSSFVDQSGSYFHLNLVPYNKTSFIFWLFSESKPDFVQLPLIKTLIQNNSVKKHTKLYDLILKHLVSMCSEYLEMANSGIRPSEHCMVNLVDSLNLIMERSDMLNNFLDWKGLGKFISVLSKSLPNKLSNLNFSIFSMLSKFVSWCEIPKQVLTKDTIVKYNRLKIIKNKVRAILNIKGEYSIWRVSYNIIDGIIKSVISKPDQIDVWIGNASQTLIMLIKCAQIQKNTKNSLKTVLNDRCLSMSQGHIDFYYRKFAQAKGSVDIKYLLRIISDYHNCKFTIY